MKMVPFCDATALAISEIKSDGFTSPEIVQRNKLERQTLSEGVVDSARFPQCEVANIQNLP